MTTARIRSLLPACVLAAAAFTPGASAIVVGTVDDFQGVPPGAQPTFSWNGASPEIVAANGPAGASDKFLRFTSTGTGTSGSHLAIKNDDLRWVGDFQGAGVTAIRADLRNFSSQALSMRIVLFGLGARFTSSLPVSIAPNQGWTSVTFPLSLSDVKLVYGNQSYQTVITNCNQIMIRHDVDPASSGGTAIAASLGIDNIRAIPAPGAGAVIGAGVMFMGRRRRRV